MADKELKDTTQLDSGTYEIIQSRLLKQKNDLQQRLHALNEERKKVFGSLETRLIANDRVNTENNCIARDIVTIGKNSIFGYNVHFGLRTEINLSDVFSIYEFDREGKDGDALRFRDLPAGRQEAGSSLELIEDPIFQTDFENLYKYYRNTIFSKFAIIGNYLHMVFQLSDSVTDIKTFKWLIKENELQYVDNRSEHEYRFPAQYGFQWKEAGRDNQRAGKHGHVSILDKVFVETIGGDLTIKVEDNTDDGQGIYREDVEHRDQTLDDGQYRYADLGNLIVLEIKPFQEEPRHFVYNHKIKEVEKIDSIAQAAVLLPDEQGIIFPSGYYLQTGEYNVFPSDAGKLKFQQKIASPNGEDHLYVFYNAAQGLYVLMSYNVIDQSVKTPIVCNGFTILEQGELCYFRNGDEQTKHHMMQIWQTPYLKGDIVPSEHQDTMLYKIGNKDIVKAMAEANELLTLLNKEDSYGGLYDDIARASKDILDAYYWLPEEETKQINLPLGEINKASNAAIDEFEKVKQMRKQAAAETKDISKKAETLFSKIKSTSFKSINDFVELLTQLRSLRGEAIGLYEIRYVDTDFIKGIEDQIVEQNEVISRRAVTFLLDDKALAPYHEAVAEKQKALDATKKVIEIKNLEKEVNQIAEDLELLIEIVSNLDIEDTSHSTKIIENISLIFATINQVKAAIKNKVKIVGKKEAQADFAAQLKLIDQSIINYLDIANTPEKCDEFLTKISIQLEELEGKFADYDEYITEIIAKREEVYAAFDNRKSSLIEARNKKAISYQNAAERIIKGVQKRAQSLDSATEINGYFASDLMINKVRDIIAQLKDLEDAGKAEAIETALKVAREDALRKLKDKNELYEDGDNIIKLGKHKFGVNKQQLDLTIVFKDNALFYHLTGTDFYQELHNEILTQSKGIWNQELVSENSEVYRAAYLAYSIFKTGDKEALRMMSPTDLLLRVQEIASGNYSGGYVKGVHDHDTAQILSVLLHKHHDLGLLTYDPNTRAKAQFFWNSLEQSQRSNLNRILKSAGEVLSVFPDSKEYDFIVEELADEIFKANSANKTDFDKLSLTKEKTPSDVTLSLSKRSLDSIKHNSNSTAGNEHQIAEYLFNELKDNDHFTVSTSAIQLKEAFEKKIKSQNADLKFKKSLEACEDEKSKVELVRHWVSAFAKAESKQALLPYTNECVANILYGKLTADKTVAISPVETITGLKGSHGTINESEFVFNYHEFVNVLEHFTTVKVPAYETFRKAKHQVTEELKESLRLEEFKPRVLSSFVRNKLIDQVYFPLIGDNLAKQLGTVGDTKRTDRMGLLLLISPPGYGKTTLMEYMANRLGLIFMKINGPAIGHDITSVDPEAASNAATREELKKLNLAFEMGDNVMLYLDDIQHCNPEFLQKFISLSDGTRKIEGVYNGKPKTYDLRSKKFCVIMAGNPYTESGDKFQIPDMLANRADIYNLGDIIGDTAHLFELSLVENALTSNPVLQQLSNKHFDDVYALIDRVQNGASDNELKGNHSNQEIADYVAVLEKVLKIRDTVLKVNEAYIASAGMEDAYRTEPSFKLQGSYRDMNKLVAKVVPIMDDKELQTLLSSHYESESQTLTSAAEANLLKYKELVSTIKPKEQERWTAIKEIFAKNNKLNGLGGQNQMSQVLNQMMDFTENLEGIKEVLKKGLAK
ncbi:ATPase family associated with various cellular activities (AAA) [Nonlabens sp. Hel1_33_55]|uniref:DNA repair ATPase n=1 Tax=Nonlabens sp. Hel1_33_55 TaxID=1336802 RepID=UPI000875EF9E|nr:DNA repair ATPase [Nonlabens sp. Hel1_33_55]SCY30888.1 ATPase family associated with various cellular activities (AAA) [Nonlabens sp. Hel1_33_55]